MSDLIVYQQGSDNAPAPDGFQQVTNPLHPNRRASSRFAHFTGDVYDLSAESHLVRLLKVLLGDAGVGQLHKRMMLARLQHAMGGVHFFDLDNFYGGIFGIRRTSNELLTANPYTDDLTIEQWDQLRVRDGSYRSRVSMFTNGLHLGVTVMGIEAVAEAVLGAEVDIVEGWKSADRHRRTWGEIEATYTDYASIESAGETYQTLEATPASPSVARNRHVIDIYPRRRTTVEERYRLKSALDRIKPAGSLIYVREGVDQVYIDVPVRNIAADSTHWEVRTEVRNTRVSGKLLFEGNEDEFVPLPIQPWGKYQGEAWSRMVENPIVIAYTTPVTISTVQLTDSSAVDLTPERVVLDNEEIVFAPSYALRPFQGIMAGRLASDGIVSSNPLTGWGQQSNPTPSSLGFPTEPEAITPVASVYIDGVPIDTFNEITQQEFGGRLSQLFWSAPVREHDAPNNDIIELRFDAPGEINQISFEVAAFPHIVDVQVWNTSPGEWQTVRTYGHYVSNPAGITGRIPDGYLHPHHFGSGHWVRVVATFEPIVTANVRFVFKRNPDGIAPVGVDGRPTVYPLGLRQVDVGYRLSALEQIPNVDEGAPIIVTKNGLGQSVRHSIYRYHPELAIDTDETYWKCEAQPIGQAVVSMFLDISDASGAPVPFDRIYLDPYTSGPTINVYWAGQEPSAAELATSATRERPILPNASVGSVSSVATGDRGLSWARGSSAWFEFDNTKTGLDISKDYWIAFEAYPLFAANENTGGGIGANLGVLSAGTDIALGYVNETVSFTSGGQTVATSAAQWTPGQKIIVVAAYRSTDDSVHIGVLNGDGTTWVSAQSTAGTHTDARPTKIRVGANNSGVSAPQRLLKMAVGYGFPSSMEALARDLDLYVRKPRYGADLTAGTVLRYHPQYEGRIVNGSYSLGFMGGQLDFWSHVSWTPIAQDFVLAKGYLRLPETRARFVKLEFSNLVAEPFEPFLSHSKTVNLYGQLRVGVAPYVGGGEGRIAPAPITGRGAIAGLGFVSDVPFEIGSIPASIDSYANAVRPTTGLVTHDPIAQARLGERAGFGWNLLAWQPMRVPPQFMAVGPHVYTQATLQHTNKVGFFAGVRTVRVCRTNHLDLDDQQMYVDKFYDWQYIESFTSGYDPGVFRTSANASAAVLPASVKVVSKTISTRRKVTGLHFATQQSPATQILPDDQFRDPALAFSAFDDVNEWHQHGDSYVIWDEPTKSVRVTRDPATVNYFITPDTTIVHPPVTPVFTTRPMAQATVVDGTEGGISSGLVNVSPQGALHLAVRLTVINKPLTDPLYVQLFASDGTTLLHEEAFTPPVDVSTEFTSRYILNGQTAVIARITQKGAHRGEWLTHAFSLYDDSILWEFSNDGGAMWVPAIAVRNNSNGMVTFPTAGSTIKWRATMYRYNLGIDSIKIRPIYESEVVI